MYSNPDNRPVETPCPQNRELVILKAIIQSVSSASSLKETLETALEIILRETESLTGWICLLDEEKGCSSFVGYRGICFSTGEEDAKPCLVRCVCNKVQTTRQTVIIRNLAPGCPLLEIDTLSGTPVSGHVSVPLTTKSRVVGQLNVAFEDPAGADRVNVELLKAVAPQLAVAVENARLWDEVQEKEALRTELLKRVVVAQEEERRRISRELHDELGQELTSLLVRLQVLENPTARQPSSQEIIGGIKTTVSEMLANIHDLALELRPTSLDDLGLVAALAQYTRASPDKLGIQVDFEAIGINGERLPREIETAVYRIVQESLTNVARHAGTNRASVLLKKNGQSIAVIIEDHGIGFETRELRSGQARMNHIGLYGMEERVTLVGGRFAVESSPGAGTTVYIEIPL